MSARPQIWAIRHRGTMPNNSLERTGDSAPKAEHATDAAIYRRA